jgi:ADP-heptose:LPS heptosyltransferase
VIGPDTGPMWATAIHNMPKIMLLSHASPTNITKHWRNTTTLHADQTRVDCWPCHKLHDIIETCRSNTEQTGAACISDISVDSLLQHAEKALSYRPEPESNVSPLMIGDRHVG